MSSPRRYQQPRGLQRLRRHLTALVSALTLWLLSGRADAQCRASSPAVLSEARGARWLIGDDLRAQAVLDTDRRREREARAELGGEEPEVDVFGANLTSYQVLPAPFPVCSSLGDVEATFARLRIHGIAGVTHRPTGLHLRVSVVAARDFLFVSSGDEDTDDARAGAMQELVAVRAGHARWGKLVLGYTFGERSFSDTGEGGLVLRPDVPRSSRAPGLFYGVTVPELHTSLLTLSQRGVPELVTVTASDLRVPRTPFAVTLGPTYLREERQVVGLLRLRGEAHALGHTRKRAVDEDDDGDGASTGWSGSAGHAGPVIEASVESNEARLRHARLRYEAATRWTFLADDGAFSKHLRGEAYFEGTVFRSRFFSASQAAAGSPRSAAWGGGAGVRGLMGGGPFFFALDAHAGINRPELLALLPSAADRVELQIGLQIRLEN